MLAAVIVTAWACADAPPPEDRVSADPTVSTTHPLPSSRDPRPAAFDRGLLQGAWSVDGESFTWSVEGDSILFEVDMQFHPFTIRGDTLLIDRGDPGIGIQKTRVVRLTADSLVVQDALAGISEVLVRLR